MMPQAALEEVEAVALSPVSIRLGRHWFTPSVKSGKLEALANAFGKFALVELTSVISAQRIAIIIKLFRSQGNGIVLDKELSYRGHVGDTFPCPNDGHRMTITGFKDSLVTVEFASG